MSVLNEENFLAGKHNAFLFRRYSNRTQIRDCHVASLSPRMALHKKSKFIDAPAVRTDCRNGARDRSSPSSEPLQDPKGQRSVDTIPSIATQQPRASTRPHFATRKCYWNRLRTTLRQCVRHAWLFKWEHTLSETRISKWQSWLI